MSMIVHDILQCKDKVNWKDNENAMKDHMAILFEVSVGPMTLMFANARKLYGASSNCRKGHCQKGFKVIQTSRPFRIDLQLQ